MYLPKRIDSPLYSVADIRAMERELFVQQDSFSVMQSAAKALAKTVITDFPAPKDSQTVHIVLGIGNNAGDGLVIATQLQQYGFQVQAYTLFEREFEGDAKKAFDLATSENLAIQPFSPFDVKANDIIIEAIFGIGLDRPTEGNVKAAINHINTCKLGQPMLTIYAVDNPAGILMDTGAKVEDAVQADKTVTFVGDKIGLHTADGKGYAGKILIEKLNSTPQTEPRHFRYHYASEQQSTTHNAHKGDFGHALIVGGSLGMFGAAALAAVSSLKVGTGKSSLYSHKDYSSQFHLDGTPLYEVMRKNKLDDVSLYSAIILGVGLGRDTWGRTVFEKTLAAITTDRPLLIDADGLWHLANHHQTAHISIITPHEAEASRLLNCSVEDIRHNKPQAVRDLAKKFHCIAVLKGAGTLISDGNTVWINESGNICLATAGTGDVLAGMIGGYLAQGFEPIDAALLGVFQHGAAADKYLAKNGSKTMRASDLWNQS